MANGRQARFLSEVRKCEAYPAWERDHGGEPLPFDAAWRLDWEAYVAANLGWGDAAWEADDAEAARAFREREGYADPAAPG